MTDPELSAGRRVLDAARRVTRLERELAEARRQQNVAVDRLYRVLKSVDAKLAKQAGA